jgi:succinate-semialdehyde dehydrogenase/glutarate-semialdehyde dehydrogenase
VMYGAFKNCGQVCCGIERLLLPESRADEITEALEEALSDLVVGNGLDEETDIGPMIRETEVDRVKNHLRAAEENGADIVRCKNLPDQEHGFWQAPALVKDVDTDMTIMNEETFGPVLPIMTYEEESEAIQEANRLEYGLAAVIYGDDPDRMKNVADQVEAGSIGLNQTVGSIVELPWGGVKKSGLGRMLNDEGVLKFTESVTERWHPEDLDELS